VCVCECVKEREMRELKIAFFPFSVP